MQVRVQLYVSQPEEQCAGSLPGPGTSSPFLLCLQVSQDAEDLHTSRLQIVAMSGTMQNVDELRQWLGAEVYVTDCRWAPEHAICRRCISSGRVAGGRGVHRRLQWESLWCCSSVLHASRPVSQTVGQLPRCSCAGLLHAHRCANQLTGWLKMESEVTCVGRQLQMCCVSIWVRDAGLCCWS